MELVLNRKGNQRAHSIGRDEKQRSSWILKSVDAEQGSRTGLLSLLKVSSSLNTNSEAALEQSSVRNETKISSDRNLTDMHEIFEAYSFPERSPSQLMVDFEMMEISKLSLKINLVLP